MAWRRTDQPSVLLMSLCAAGGCMRRCRRGVQTRASGKRETTVAATRNANARRSARPTTEHTQQAWHAADWQLVTTCSCDSVTTVVAGWVCRLLGCVSHRAVCLGWTGPRRQHHIHPAVLLSVVAERCPCWQLGGRAGRIQHGCGMVPVQWCYPSQAMAGTV